MAGVDDEVLGFEAWQGTEGFQEFPEGIIDCPLSGDQLRAYFSLSTVAPEAVTGTSIYKQQEDAYTSFCKNPPLTYGRSGTAKSAKQTMTPLEDSTIQSRCKHMNHFNGFCVKWLGVEPNYGNIMTPIHTAKYVGFHQAKGSNPSTIKTFISSIFQMIHFVASTYCQHTTGWADAYVEKTKQWYANLQGSLVPNPRSAFVSKATKHTLWEIWEKGANRWQEAMHKLQVIYNTTACKCVQAPTSPHQPPPAPTSPHQPSPPLLPPLCVRVCRRRRASGTLHCTGRRRVLCCTPCTLGSTSPP